MTEFDEQMERLARIFNAEKVPCVSEKTLGQYLAYLKENIILPCHLTGVEDFLWEEFYVFGPGDSDEYEELKKTQASYTDTFQLLHFEDEVDIDHGIFVKVRRIIGVNRKQFVLELSWLKCTDETSGNDQLLDDYDTWFTNFR